MSRLAALLALAFVFPALEACAERAERASSRTSAGPELVAVAALLDDLRFTPDSRRLLAVAPVSTTARLDDVGPDGRRRRLRTLGPAVYGGALRPDARAIVQHRVGQSRSWLEVRALPGGRRIARRRIPPYTFGVFRALWSPGGEHFLVEFEGGAGTRVFDGRTARLVRVLDSPGVLPRQIWTTDGRRVLTRRGIVDVTTGRREALRGDVKPLALSPDGTRLAGAQGTGPAAIVDLASGDVRSLPFRAAQSAAWSPDGRRLAVFTQDGDRVTVAVVDDLDGEPRTTVLGRFRGGTDEPLLTWSPDGRRLAFGYEPPLR